jgi:hypothetical protein
MKRLSIILFCSVVFLCLVQACAALTASNILTTPTQLNALKPGDVISEVSGTITLPTSGSETFNSDDSVEFYTQLDDARWSISIVVGGIENPARTYGGKHATIGGYDLSYPTSGYSSVALKFSMTSGKIPSSLTSGTIILVRVLEMNPDSLPVGAAVSINGTVISTEALSANVSRVNSDLTNLKADIDAKSNVGVDVTIPLQKYQIAKNALDNAKNDLISAPTQVVPLLGSATASINEAQTALDKAWADHSIQQAKAMLGSVDGLINEFTVNDSLKTNDPRLVAIINKRDLAAQAISNANDLFTTGTYPSARTKADDGTNLANQAWNLSLDLKTELGQGFSLPLPNLGAFLPVLIVIVVVAIIAGVIIYRKKMHWDELG